MSFAQLKKNRATALSKLTAAAQSNTKSFEDNRFWEPALDKSGAGSFVIRFLTQNEEKDDLPYVKLWTRGFQGPSGKWYIENCLTTIGGNDPVGEFAGEIWNRGGKENEDEARKYKRKLSYISNILVISDPTNPANEGKVFLFRYGKKIHDKIIGATQPEFADEDAVNVFDYWEGANFKLKIRQVEGYRNYDKCEFDKPSPISKNESEIEKIYDSLYTLNEFVHPSKFKTYDELKAKLRAVLGDQAFPAEAARIVAEPTKPAPSAGKTETAKPAPTKGTNQVETDTGEDDEYFRALANS